MKTDDENKQSKQTLKTDIENKGQILDDENRTQVLGNKKYGIAMKVVIFC